MILPDAEPVALLEAFLAVHAAGSAVPVQLYARGEALHRQLSADPPRDRAWGRFLVALGSLAANELDDPATASRLFLSCLQSAERHGDHEAAVAAGYNQGVLQERRSNWPHAVAAYRAAAGEGFRLGVSAATVLRAALAAVRLGFAEQQELTATDARLAKQAWLLWLWLRSNASAELDRELATEAARQCCAFLLPEDDPLQLAARWRSWAPAAITIPAGRWEDGDAPVMEALFLAAADAADQHLRDEIPDPGAPYRALLAAHRRAQAGRRTA